MMDKKFKADTIQKALAACSLVLAFFVFATNAFAKENSVKPRKNLSYLDLPNATNIDSQILLLIDQKTKKILWSKNPYQVWPMASLTKVMTAAVFLDQDPDLERVVTYHKKNDKEGARLYVYEGETLTLRDLFYAMLVGSANNAAYALVEQSGLTQEQFVKAMNEKAKAWGLDRTVFVEPSGLDEYNVSTAYDLAKMARKALKYGEIFSATTTQEYYFLTKNTGAPHTLRNSNHLLTKQSNLEVTGGKTGFIYESYYNLITRIDENGHRVIGVILGNQNSEDRFWELYDAFEWAFSNWTWK